MKKQYFSLRKHKVGLISVMIGASLFFISPQAQAAETVTESPTPVATALDVTTSIDNNQATSLPDSVSSETEKANDVVTTSPTIETPTTNEQPSEVEQNTPVSQANDQTSASDTPQTIAEPLNKSSNEIVNVEPAWKEGYKGEGMVVAIIDSGVDIEHDVLRISDVSKAKYKNEQQIEEAKQAAGINYGKWYNDKVIFGYNYVDANTNLKEANEHSHGMHVTGISTGNPSKVDSSGELITGVAPEAQVMFMRVFVDRSKTTDTPLYARAIEDAVKLGADSINLSLGSTTGSVTDTDPSIITAIEKARQAGVTVTIAAGNDGYFGSGAAKPLAGNPDYGLVGSPSTAQDAISVASFNNTTKTSEVMSIVDQDKNETLNYGKSVFTAPGDKVPAFEKGKTLDYIFANLGKKEDFENLDLTGKVALIQRGEITFTDKINNAIAKGAIGAIIFNNRENGDGDNLTMSVAGDATKIPSVFLPYKIGTALSKGNYQLQFNGEYLTQPNSEAGKMSDFSSWGLSTDGELKPDLAAPGGTIYASINNNKYTSMNGTSMAAPHVAGAAVLVKQRLLEKYPDKTPAEIEQLVKHLLMSTAQPHVDQTEKTFNSPRQQGAGIMDTHQALHSDVYLTGTNDYGSLSLGNVDSRFNFDVLVHNIGDTAQTLKYQTTLLTDKVEDGHITLLPKQLLQLEGTTLTVAPHSTQKVTIEIDASQFDKELTKQMPNGYYLEGFVNFTEVNSDKHLVSIPYVGFKGQFQNLPVTEKSVYHLAKENKEGVYFTPNETKEIPTDANYTGLITTVKQNDTTAITALGTFENENGKFILHTNDKGNVILAISPNDDDNQDSTAFKGVFLRNYTHLKATVYEMSDKKLAHPLWHSKSSTGSKNYYSGNEDNKKSDMILATEWDGKDKDGNTVPDGKYKYIVSYRPDIPGAKSQTMTFILDVDTKAPVITTATYDESAKLFKPRQIIETGSGIAQQVITYSQPDQEGKDKIHYIYPEKDGSFKLPEDVKIEDLTYKVVDFAGNQDNVKVDSLITPDNQSGRVLIQAVNHDTKEPEKMTFTYIVKDEQGHVVENIDKSKEGISLPFGKYTVHVLLYDKDNARLVSEPVQTVEVTKDNSLQTVNFEIELIKYTPFTIAFNQPLPSNSQVALVDNNGQKFILPPEKYLTAGFGKRIPVGDYTIDVTLAPNYAIYEQDLSLKVKKLGNPIKHLTLINKTTLAQLATQTEGLEQAPVYYNANEQLKATYNQAIEQAKSALTAPHTQLEVDQFTMNLQTAIAALNGKATDYSQLQQAVAQPVTEHPAYYNASLDLQQAYLQAHQVAKQAVTAKLQSEVDLALQQLRQAEQALNGKATDYSQLQQAVAQPVTEHPAYYNASLDLQQAYLQAHQVAKQAVAAKLQSEVDLALQQLQQAEQALNGKATDYSQLQQAVAQPVTEQPAYYNASLDLQQAYLQAHQVAKQAVAAKLQSEVDLALQQLQQAEQALNGKATDYSQLQQAVAQPVTEQPAYYNASLDLQQAYLQAHQVAKQAVAAKLQSEVDLALQQLEQAKQALNGKATDYSQLQQMIDKNKTFTKTAAQYIYAERQKQTAYDQALIEAQTLLNQPNSTQQRVDDALAALTQAQDNLDGRAPVTTTVPKVQKTLSTVTKPQSSVSSKLDIPKLMHPSIQKQALTNVKIAAKVTQPSHDTSVTTLPKTGVSTSSTSLLGGLVALIALSLGIRRKNN